ncbi:hypothetical protein D3C72_1457230 [compost metagenome]
MPDSPRALRRAADGPRLGRRPGVSGAFRAPCLAGAHEEPPPRLDLRLLDRSGAPRDDAPLRGGEPGGRRARAALGGRLRAAPGRPVGLRLQPDRLGHRDLGGRGGALARRRRAGDDSPGDGGRPAGADGHSPRRGHRGVSRGGGLQPGLVPGAALRRVGQGRVAGGRRRDAQSRAWRPGGAVARHSDGSDRHRERAPSPRGRRRPGEPARQGQRRALRGLPLLPRRDRHG